MSPLGVPRSPNWKGRVRPKWVKPVQLQLVNQGGILLTEGRTFSSAFIVAFKDIDRRSVEKGRGTNALPITSLRRNAASDFSVSRHPGFVGRHVHFRESAFRDNYAAPRHPIYLAKSGIPIKDLESGNGFVQFNKYPQGQCNDVRNIMDCLYGYHYCDFP
ncbi:hypothetical protein TNCV_1034621 [Trichonephila clavipes]|nr:hypothetical protein TNCV_1034621 [Trichonephila clavipes]